MKIVFSALFLVFTLLVFSQQPVQEKPKRSLIKTEQQKAKEKAQKAPISSYKIVSLDRDTTFVDTSLTIKKEYEFNYLRKDNFGLLPFANEGHTYTTLQFGLVDASPYPDFGYKAKHFNYLEVNDVNYYSVATPLTEMYFKTVMQQGQSSDVFITLNTSERFNFSIGYKGLRSLGKYINQLSSNGNFTFTSSYNTKNKRYFLNLHFTGQDSENGENGGITTAADFESKNPDYKERQRLEVYLTDAKTFMKGKRLFFDHNFRINSKEGSNNLTLKHQFNYEYKFFEYNQVTVASTVGDKTVNRFGDSFVTRGINDQVRYNRMYNKVGLEYENTLLGKFQFFVDDFRYNYYYNSVFVLSDKVVPSSLNDEINSFGGQYQYQRNKWKGKFLYSNSITNQSLTAIEANLNYKINDENQVTFQYQNNNKVPNHIYNLHQSSYTNYNWYNDFKNEKNNAITVDAKTQWINATLQVSTLKDFLYFQNTSSNDTIQLIIPKQYDKTINYLSLKVNKEFKFWKLGLDNTLLFQKADQDNLVLNVPELVTRNTFYFTDYFFKKALYLQTGITFNYFIKYYANDYNPVVSEFFVQNNKQIGDFANCDFFVNARIRQTRIFVKAEHFNSAFSATNTFYSAPNYPYRDFMIRFGLVWNFFQ
jgi:hypothetical protein